MKHTKGEWRADKSGCVVSDAGMICDVGFMNVNPEANARLIAAAPVGLKLAEAILVQNEYGIDRSKYILKTAKEFIAKAQPKVAADY